MTNTSPPPPPATGTGSAEQPDPSGEQGPGRPRNELLELGRLRRSGDRRIAGVAGGIARHLDIDPIIVRVTLVVLVFFGGSGLLLYGALWLLVPEEGSSARPLGLDDRNRNLALIGTGVLAAISAVGDFAGAFWFPWPLVILALLVVWFLNRKEQNSGPYVPVGNNAPAAPYPQVPGHEQTQAYGPTQAYPQGQPYQPYTYVKPRNPRKRGPILFWFTLALIATGVGTLGVIDVSGTAVPSAAYPALALALTGAMLLLGAFWGRAGGLILIGLVLTVGTLATTTADNYDGERLEFAPISAAAVSDSYHLDTGRLLVDLSAVTDVDGLDGRELSVDGGVGDIVVIVPDGMDITVAASTGIGDVNVFDQHQNGLDVNQDGFLDGGYDVPDMRINIDLGVGQVTVREQ